MHPKVLVLSSRITVEMFSYITQQSRQMVLKLLTKVPGFSLKLLMVPKALQLTMLSNYKTSIFE